MGIFYVLGTLHNLLKNKKNSFSGSNKRRNKYKKRQKKVMMNMKKSKAEKK